MIHYPYDVDLAFMRFPILLTGVSHAVKAFQL